MSIAKTSTNSSRPLLSWPAHASADGVEARWRGWAVYLYRSLASGALVNGRPLAPWRMLAGAMNAEVECRAKHRVHSPAVPIRKATRTHGSISPEAGVGLCWVLRVCVCVCHHMEQPGILRAVWFQEQNRPEQNWPCA